MTEKEYLVRGKGIYDSDTRSMEGTGLYIYDGRVTDRGIYEELAARYGSATLLDFQEDYILPGLVNTHVHLEFTPCEDTYGIYVKEDANGHRKQAERAARELLLSGVTAARDAGSSMDLVRWMGKICCGNEPHQSMAPRLQMSGMPLTVSGGHLGFLGVPSDSTDELLKAVRDRKEAGCTCIKLIVSGGQMTPESLPEQEAYTEGQVKEAVCEAHRHGLPVVAHCLTVKSYESAMDSGVDCIEHAACFVRNPGSGLLERRLEPERLNRFHGDRRFLMVGFSNNYRKLSPEQEERECEIVRYFVEAGMRPTVGTDAGCGLTYFDETWLELELLVKRCGLTNQEAIHAATVTGAEALGWGERLGALKQGYLADFIAVKRNPLEDISAFRQVSHVFSRGQLIK